MPQFTRAALLVVDVQKAIDAAYHAAAGPRNNPDAERNIARLLAEWRREQRPIVHIRHDSTSAASAYRPGQEGNEFKDEVAPAAGETVIPKRTNSAFIGTGLEQHLRESGLETLVVVEEIGARVLHALIEKQAVEIVSEIVVVRDVLLCLADWVCLLEALEAARDATQHFLQRIGAELKPVH